MTTTTTAAPPPVCSGEFRARCVVCHHRAHPAPVDGPNRMCVDGHQPYVALGRCRPCYNRDQRAGRLPKRTPVPRRTRAAPAKPPPVPTVQTEPPPPDWKPVPVELRSTTPASCDRCGHLGRLAFGPGEALCLDCGLAQLLDRDASALLRSGAS